MIPRALVLISGWAFPPETWETAARVFSPKWDLTVLDPGLLMKGWEPDTKDFAPYPVPDRAGRSARAPACCSG